MKDYANYNPSMSFIYFLLKRRLVNYEWEKMQTPSMDFLFLKYKIVLYEFSILMFSVFWSIGKETKS